ncbi:unnamed protein product [Hyaloperonospora brassicae]|uniref:Fanconi Anaemia group E protein C-terminal domain-containing protein n=1 Tax=Hyaloperonospora brassicae TaxID=162125 RepID=A0AAV0UZG5_HYABA|nr:unnamed protein product [Hyaloperonospora brassicae]
MDQHCHHLPQRVSFLAFTAQSKGAPGVRAYLTGHCQQSHGVLRDLSAPVLRPNDPTASVTSRSVWTNRTAREALDVGICMEHLSRRAQREIWSALASGAPSPVKDSAEGLARAFLRAAGRPRALERDAYCVSLATVVLRRASGTQENEGLESAVQTTSAAFQRRMQRFLLHAVQLPSSCRADGRAEAVSLDEDSSGRVAVVQTCDQRNKRQRTAVPETTRPHEPTRSPQERTIALVSEPEERPVLPKEVETRAAGLSKQLAQLARPNTAADADNVATRTFNMLADVVNDVHTTYAANEQSFQYLCTMLRMHSTSDDALARIISALVDANWSSRYAAIFLNTSVLPRIRAAETVISRALLQTTLLFGATYVDTLIDSLLLPLLVGDEHTTVGPAQAEALTRILCSPNTALTDRLDEFVQKSLAVVAANEGSSAGAHLLANESALLVLQNILNTKPKLSSLTVDKFVEACEAVLEQPEAHRLRGSLRFTTVVFTLITKYPQQCACHVEALEAIVAQLSSIMAKATMRSLEKLKIKE